MHFSKTYAQLLLTLPHELQQNAIAYRQVSARLFLPTETPTCSLAKLAQKARQWRRVRAGFSWPQPGCAPSTL